jgi:acetylornithine/succinyldiaminopimelate/putrescine aminotransferase
MDAVQCGYFRTGRFQSFQRILEGPAPSVPDHSGPPDGAALPFLPDGISMAKSLGGGFPIGAFWVREPYADLLAAGSHGTTFGGTPLACGVALKVMEIIDREHLADNARRIGEFLMVELQRLIHAYPGILKGVRGLGLMIGLELVEKERIAAFAHVDKAASNQFVNRLHEAGVLTVPSGAQTVRFLPALNLTRQQAEEGLAIVERVVASLA